MAVAFDRSAMHGKDEFDRGRRARRRQLRLRLRRRASIADIRARDRRQARLLGAFDGEQLVGVSAELPFRDGPARRAPTCSVTGLTWVSVELTHRRRGVLRAPHRAPAAGRPPQRVDAALILGASEGGIYGRYGFGVAVQARDVPVVTRRRSRLASDPSTSSAVHRLTGRTGARGAAGVSTNAGAGSCRVVWRATNAGGRTCCSTASTTGAARPACSTSSTPTGTSRTRSSPSGGRPTRSTGASIVDYVPVTREAHAALWQVLLSMDLVALDREPPRTAGRPVAVAADRPARGRDDPRSVTTMWLRPVDVERLLGAPELRLRGRVRARRLVTACSVTVDTSSAADRDGATCTRTDRTPDLTVDVADLGAVSAGRSPAVAGGAHRSRRLAPTRPCSPRLDHALPRPIGNRHRAPRSIAF